MNWAKFKEDCEQSIYLARGGIVHESGLHSRYDLTRAEWDHLYSYIEDYIYDADDAEHIDWPAVWLEWEQAQEGLQT